MKKRKNISDSYPNPGDDMRLDPEKRICNKFDSDSIAKFPVAQPGDMGFRVVDNCAEEHIM